jgi:hypothetical protein
MPDPARPTPATLVLTRSYDNGRTGACYTERIFTPDKIASAGLKGFKSLTVNTVNNFGANEDDPRIEAQPLYVPNIVVNGKKRNVVFLATMANRVWAFDADEPDETKHMLWKTQFGEPFLPPENQKPGQHRSTKVDSHGINIRWGILSTPVIDLDANRMYLVNWTLGPDKKPALTAYQLNLLDGSQIGQGVALKAVLTDANGNVVNDALGKPVELHPDQKQRAALLLVPLRGQHKALFIATTGGENPGSPHGWVVAMDTDSFVQTAAWVSTPSSFGGGIWQGSQGMAADDVGNVYAVTANGGYIHEPRNQIKDFVGDTDFAEAVVKLRYQKTGASSGTLELVDWFIPFLDSDRHSEKNYNYRDQDLGSAGPVLPVNTDLVLAGGKDGMLYVLDRTNFGKKIGDLSVLKSPPIYVTYNGEGLPVTGDLDFPLGDATKNPSKTHHLHGSPVYWDGSDGPMLFTWGENESLRAWKLNAASGKLSFVGKGLEVASAAAAVFPTGIGGMPGGMLALSSDGKTPHTGIVWTLAPVDGDANQDVVEGDRASLRRYTTGPHTNRSENSQVEASLGQQASRRVF